MKAKLIVCMTLFASIIAAFAPACSAQVVEQPAQPSNIDGAWAGVLNVQSIQLHVVFKIASTPAGLTAQLQSPDQSPAWIPVTAVKRDGASLTIEVKAIGAVYAGKIAADLSAIDGTFTQMGNPLPLALKRVKNESALEPKRPQNPVKPYPYREEEVTYTNKAAGDTLAATLTIDPTVLDKIEVWILKQ